MAANERYSRRVEWFAARKAETVYSNKLRGVARQVGMLVGGITPDGYLSNKQLAALLKLLDDYALAITPWAEATAAYMINDVARRTEKVWKSVGRSIGQGIRYEIAASAQGAVFRQSMAENVELITSLPRKAGKRVHDLTMEALTTGERAESIAQKILATESVTTSRARLIARTEVARTAANFVEARARAAGSQGYIWRTSKDADVRPTHKKMEGVYVPWDAPPKTDKDLDPYHAGCGPNCRCYAEPIFPEIDDL